MFKSPLIWIILTVAVSFLSGVVIGPKLFTKSTIIKDAVSVSTKVDKKYPTVSPSRIIDKVEVEKLKAEIAAKTEMLSKPTVSSSIYNSNENETEIFKPKITLYKRKLPGGSCAWMEEPPTDPNEPIITYEMVQAQEPIRKAAVLREILEKQTKGTIFTETPSGYFKFLSANGTVKVYSPELQLLHTTFDNEYGPYGAFLFLNNLIETWELAAQKKYQQAMAESEDDLSLQEIAKVNLSNDIQTIVITKKLFRIRLDAIYENQFLTPKRKLKLAMELLGRAYIPDLPIVMPTQPLEFRVKDE
jgi:hypothetical protein